MFPYKDKNCLSRAMINCVVIFMGIILALYVAFGNMTIFIVLILSIHEHRKLFHILISSVSPQYFKVFFYADLLLA